MHDHETCCNTISAASSENSEPNHGCCACDHTHETHEHSVHGDCGCGCGHEHGGEERAISPAELVISILLFAAGIILENFFHMPVWVDALCFGGATVIAGWRIFWDGLKALVKVRLDETTLMTIAVIAAFCLGQFDEAAMVAILFQIGELLEDKAVDRSRKNIEDLAGIRPDTARKLVDGEETVLPAEQITVGDQISVHPYERIPLDGVILSGASSLDSSALTGESLPLDAHPGVEVLSGMMNGQGMITVQVTNDFSNSAASRVIDMVESASARKGSAEKLITRFAQVYTPIVIALAILLMTFPPLLGLGAFETWLYRAMVFLVASCPCALVISVPLGFYAGIGVQSKNGVLVKGGKYLESLAKARAVVFDKTGTLTSGKLSVSRINSFGSYSEEELTRLAASAEQYSAHPAAKAILAHTKEAPFEALNVNEFAGRGVSAIVDGKTILCGRKALLEEHGMKFENVSPASIYIAVNGKLEGSVELEDTPKEDSAEGIQKLKELGVSRIVMLTGDNEKAAASAAEKCGVPEYHASLLPGDKVDLMEKIRRESGTTLFVGDGINDAPVLAASDCGIAMGLGTDAAIEASDTVLMADKISKLGDAISLARRAMKVIRFNIWGSLVVKALVLILAAFGYAPMALAVFADVGVTMIAVANASRILRFRPRI